MSKETAFLVEKAISVPLVAAAISFLSPFQVMTAFIVLGQAHFFIAYLYQYRAGKVTLAYRGLYLVVFASWLALLLYFHRLDLLIVSAGIVFLVHFLQDEVFLAGKKPALMRSLEMAPVFFLYAGLLLGAVMRIRLMPLMIGLAVALLAAYAALLIRKRQLPDRLSLYFLSISALLLSLSFFEVRVPIQVLLGTLILLHYSSWYIAYFFKVRENAERLRSYLSSVVICNLLALCLYLVFLSTSFGKSWLFFLFLPGYFYVWTLMHTLFSIRWGDWKGSLS